MSKHHSTARARRAAVGALAAGAVVAGLVYGGTTAVAAPNDSSLTKLAKPLSFKDGRYVVILREPGATRYAGGQPGLAATRSTRGQFDSRSPEVQAYSRHLVETHRDLAREVGATVADDYTLALSGFAAQLSGEQAAELSRDRRVLTVAPDAKLKLDTWASPDFLGLTGKTGAWAKHGGKKNAGAGTVVGILDTGIWPESKSFAGDPLTRAPQTKWDIRRLGDRTYMDKADGSRFEGVCMTGEGFDADDCNTKLIGARYYPDIFSQLPEEDTSPDEYMSPRDGDGHGTHTAGTAAGNAGVKAKVEGRSFGRVSGMAPAARIAAYKVCYNDNDPNTGDCYTSSSIAAIDDAIGDGVDVVNYSISGSQDTVVDAVELAFEGAAEAGIFVATSAGNSGPGAETVAHPSPWLATVAASTHVRFENTVILGNGKKILGASINDAPLSNHKLVNSADIPAAGQLAEDAELCLPDSLDPTLAVGKIVVCTRGVNARVEKSAEVERAGGVGMILANPSENSLDADFHAVPTVHIDEKGTAKLFNYMAAEGAAAKARFEIGNLTKKVTPVPQVAGFSSRGPSLANDADIIKPDIAAPGVSVLAAVAPPTNSNRKFDLYSGTSMASPHIAGLAAFLAGERPDWTPMQVKSAMMTTARSLLDENGKPIKDPFAQGAGNVKPKRFFNPGLFITATPREWMGFITGQGYPVTNSIGEGYAPVEAKDVNQPSMAQGQVVGSVRFDRRLQAAMRGTWKVSVKVPGFSASHTKKLVSSRSRDVLDLRVKFTRTTAPLGEFATGWVVLSGPTQVRIPVALRPVSVKAPRTVEGTGTDGSVEIPVTAGFTGDLAVEESGLAESTSFSDTVAVGADDVYACLTVPATSKVLRADLDSLQDDADLDLFVYKADDTCSTLEYEAGVSATGAADESVTLPDPEPGNYAFFVNGYADAPGESDGIPYEFDVYDVNDTTTLGGFHADPNPVPVVAGQPTSFDAIWSGLTADRRYLGVLAYEGALSPTYVRVSTPAP